MKFLRVPADRLRKPAGFAPLQNVLAFRGIEGAKVHHHEIKTLLGDFDYAFDGSRGSILPIFELSSSGEHLESAFVRCEQATEQRWIEALEIFNGITQVERRLQSKKTPRRPWAGKNRAAPRTLPGIWASCTAKFTETVVLPTPPLVPSTTNNLPATEERRGVSCENSEVTLAIKEVSSVRSKGFWRKSRHRSAWPSAAVQDSIRFSTSTPRCEPRAGGAPTAGQKQSPIRAFLQVQENDVGDILGIA